MKVLVVHNAYQNPGGEDAVVKEECLMLRDRGHSVQEYARDNHELHNMSAPSALLDTLWSRRTVEEISIFISRERPDVVHVHNTFPLISPSVYWVADKHRIPVVQTLHNFRLACVQAMLLRNGRVCEDCLGRVPWRGVLRKCYRGSLAQSGALAAMVVAHRMLGTYSQKVTRYVALNDFCRNKFVEAGLPAEKLVVKPNFVNGESTPDWTASRAGALFVGRLSSEKGIATLAAAADIAASTQVTVVGSGPELAALQNRRNVECVGFLEQAVTRKKMKNSRYLVMPSIWYENFPRTLVEAFAEGLPVVASRIGAMAELIRDGETGLLFEPGNSRELAEKMLWADDNPEKMLRMGKNARAEFETKYSPDVNYDSLMNIYREAIEVRRREHR